MRRWNGWGDDGIVAQLRPEALAFLRERLGAAPAPRDAALDRVLAQVATQPSRLPPHPAIDCSAAARLAASFGQSSQDWLRLRFGAIDRVTDGVAWPTDGDEVHALLHWAAAAGVAVLPMGGATSVVGHLAPADERPLLTLAMARMMRLKWLDPVAQLASFEAGVSGPELESQLRARGFTLGHYPQSFEYSTLGGWVVTRSSGQQSALYGRIEQLFAGGTLITPTGATLRVGGFPASAAGPDLREWVLGSEGRLGVLIEATVRVSRAPEVERFEGIFFPDWPRALDAVRELAQARLGLSMLRLANAAETLTTLALAGHARAIAWLQRYLALRSVAREGQCLLFAGLTGARDQVVAMRRLARAIASRHGGVGTGTLLGRKWAANRFRGVYLRNALWDAGYAVETMETACDWSRTAAMVQAIEAAGAQALAAAGERVHAYSHLSHVYPTGSSVYSTFVYRIGNNFDEALARWRALKTGVGDAIAAHGGTISHQHGVGKDHLPWLAREKGESGLAAIAALLHHADPHGVMARGNLLGDGQ